MGFLRELIARRPVADANDQTVEAQAEDAFDYKSLLEDELEIDVADCGLNDTADPDAYVGDPEGSGELALPDAQRIDTTDVVADAEMEGSGEAEEEGSEPEPEMVKIWEMLNNDAPDDAGITDEADIADDAGGVETTTDEPSPQELAREAMNDLIVRRGTEADPPKRGGRDKTRILGFGSPEGGGADLFKRTDQKPREASDRFPLAWLVIIEGPGRGASFTLQHEVSSIGRGSDQRIKIDFGDNSISRENHAAIAFDDDLVKFFVGHGGKSNLVRLNGRPVLMTEEITDGDLIRVGETTLRFVAFCSPEFAWDLTEEPEDLHARAG